MGFDIPDTRDVDFKGAFTIHQLTDNANTKAIIECLPI